MIRGFLLWSGNGVEFGLGDVNFMNGDGENRRVRCGWMYYAEKCPEYGLFRLKTPRVYHVKKSAIFYDGRITESARTITERLFYFKELSFFDKLCCYNQRLYHGHIHISIKYLPQSCRTW